MVSGKPAELDLPSSHHSGLCEKHPSQTRCAFFKALERRRGDVSKLYAILHAVVNAG
jgi:hypothetical protein